jgi:hypothetical protein
VAHVTFENAVYRSTKSTNRLRPLLPGARQRQAAVRRCAPSSSKGSRPLRWLAPSGTARGRSAGSAISSGEIFLFIPALVRLGIDTLGREAGLPGFEDDSGRPRAARLSSHQTLVHRSQEPRDGSRRRPGTRALLRFARDSQEELPERVFQPHPSRKDHALAVGLARTPGGRKALRWLVLQSRFSLGPLLRRASAGRAALCRHAKSQPAERAGLHGP